MIYVEGTYIQINIYLYVFKGVCMLKYLQKQNTRQQQANGKHMVCSYRQHFANCSLTRLMSHATGGQPTTKMTFSKARTKESEDGGERERETAVKSAGHSRLLKTSPKSVS